MEKSRLPFAIMTVVRVRMALPIDLATTVLPRIRIIVSMHVAMRLIFLTLFISDNISGSFATMTDTQPFFSETA